MKSIKEGLPAAGMDRRQINSGNNRRKPIEVEDLFKKTMIILSRQIDQLTVSGFDKPLTGSESRSLVDYIKLINDLRRESKDEIEDLADDALLAIADPDAK